MSKENLSGAQLAEKISEEMGFLLKDITAYSHLSALACELAQQAGEEVKRPLTEAQLSRAWDVWRQERNILATYVYASAQRVVERQESSP